MQKNSKIINMKDITKNSNTNKNGLEEKDDNDSNKILFLLLNIDKKHISSSLLEYSIKKNKLSVLAYSKQETTSIVNGKIQNIDKSDNALKKNLMRLKNIANIDTLENLHVVANIDSSLADYIHSTGTTNFIDKEIENVDISEVIQKSVNSSNVPIAKKIINLKVNSFKIDDNFVANPLGMSCQRLEVETYTQLMNQIDYNNIIKIMQKNSLNLDFLRTDSENLIDAILTEEEKEFGANIIYILENETKILFVKNNVLEKEEHILAGKQTIIENISNTFKVSLKVSNYILNNINIIAESSTSLGYFEIETPDKKIQQINFDLLIDTVSKTLQTILEAVKMNIINTQSNSLSQIVFVKTLNINGVENFFNDLFKENIKDIRTFTHVSRTFEQNIYNVEMLSNEYALLGMCSLILNEKDFYYNQNIVEITNLIKKRSKKTSFSSYIDINTPANLGDIKLGEKKSLIQRFGKLVKDLW